jgi:hypothetical protein
MVNLELDEREVSTLEWMIEVCWYRERGDGNDAGMQEIDALSTKLARAKLAPVERTQDGV